jgi:hypothetical protein
MLNKEGVGELALSGLRKGPFCALVNILLRLRLNLEKCLTSYTTVRFSIKISSQGFSLLKENARNFLREILVQSGQRSGATLIVNTEIGQQVYLQIVLLSPGTARYVPGI